MDTTHFDLAGLGAAWPVGGGEKVYSSTAGNGREGGTRAGYTGRERGVLREGREWEDGKEEESMRRE